MDQRNHNHADHVLACYFSNQDLRGIHYRCACAVFFTVGTKGKLYQNEKRKEIR